MILPPITPQLDALSPLTQSIEGISHVETHRFRGRRSYARRRPQDPPRPSPPVSGSASAGHPARRRLSAHSRLGGLPVHSDAALFAMQSAIDPAGRELDAALDALKAADEVYSDREPAAPAEPGGPVFSAEEQRAVDAMAAKLREGRERGRPPEWVVYEHAVQDHEREIERLKAERGVTAANELEAAALSTTGRAAQALIDTPPRRWRG